MHFNNTKTKTDEKYTAWGPEALSLRQESIRRNRSLLAAKRERWITKNSYFYRAVGKLFAFLVEPHKSVLNVGCQTGFFLKAVSARRGVGVDMSSEMIAIAKTLRPEFAYTDNISALSKTAEKFDYIIYSDIAETVDVLDGLRSLKGFCQRHTRLLIYSYNHLWEPLVMISERLGWKMPEPQKNWLSENDIRDLLTVAGYEWLKTHKFILFPKYIPLLSSFFNVFLARLPFIRRLCVMQVLIARPLLPALKKEELTVSVIIPCKNEQGNIEHAVRRIPKMGRHTEIVFCDDLSTDNTVREIRKAQEKHPALDIQLVSGPGICKSKNVWAGFDAASSDILMILDGDLTVMPEELTYFFDTIAGGTAEFVNGSRLVYPMPKGAMKVSNMIGNNFFSNVFSFILGQRIRDTLCGTKVLFRTDWERIKPMVDTWGTTDRWGDYDLLFGASKLNLKIIDLPVHYQERIYGATKMTKVFRHGLIMLTMCFHGYKKLHGKKAY
ncbi:MAG: glycosyltransferase [Candidatus Omnitrophica bacterium]|nr:glycosyltransferase [Candidatus Omnitrophota bacterium]